MEHFLTTSRDKIHEKTLGLQIGSKLRFFCHFLKVASLVFFDIAQDCSLRQCLTSSRPKTSKKKKKNWESGGPKLSSNTT